MEAHGNEARHPVFQQIWAMLRYHTRVLDSLLVHGPSIARPHLGREKQPQNTGGQQPHRVTREDKDRKTHSPVSTAGTAQTVMKIQVDEGGVGLCATMRLYATLEYELNRFHTL